jgi:hypothetical protein
MKCEARKVIRSTTNVPLVSTPANPSRAVSRRFALATGHLLVGSAAASLAVVLGAAGGAWLLLTHRRVRTAEVCWEAMKSDKPVPPPSS